MFDWLRIVPVLSRSRDLRLRDDPRCKVERNVRAANGWLLDRYLPSRPSGGSLILLHGWTLRGKDHTRLQVFARRSLLPASRASCRTCLGLRR